MMGWRDADLHRNGECFADERCPVCAEEMAEEDDARFPQQGDL